MAQQNLNRSEVRAGIEHVGGAGVPEQVRMNTTADAGAVTTRWKTALLLAWSHQPTSSWTSVSSSS